MQRELIAKNESQPIEVAIIYLFTLKLCNPKFLLEWPRKLKQH